MLIIEFNNSCGCLVEYDILEKAIIEECKRRNIIPKNNYKIYMYRDYAGISLKHDKVSVHRIIGKYMVGFNFGKDIHVHHLDGNKLNNKISNLQVIRKDLHIKTHYMVQYVSKEYIHGFGERMKKIIVRKDVTKEKIEELQKRGLSIIQISYELGCGENTVRRRLGMKS